MRRVETGLLLCFFVSGASALLYEVLWTRMLGWLFGTTLLSVSMTVTAFMAGLALGGRLGQSIATRRSDRLGVYCALEALMGLTGVGVTCLLPHLAGVAAHVQAGGQLALLFLLLLLPTTLMGATLPILSLHLSHGSADVAAKVARLYAVNTLGAVLGALLCDFALIPTVGLRETGIVAGLGNLLVATLVLAMRHRLPSHLEPPGPAADPPPLWVLWSFAVSGFAALAFEVLWTRSLLFFEGAAIFVFSIILATFLTGLAGGAWLVQRSAERMTRPAGLLAVLQIFLAVAGGLSLLVMSRLDPLLQQVQASLVASGWVQFLVGTSVSCVLIMLPSTLAMGATFPLYIRLAGGDVGRPYAWNTVGSALGSLAAGFWLLPVLGLQKALLVTSLLCAALAVWTAIRGGARLAAAAGLVVAGALVVALLAVPGEALTRSTWEARYGHLAYFADDIENTVAVADEYDWDGSMARRLFVNGFSMTGTTFKSRRYMRLMGHLPVLVHPDPHRALVICVGTGMTLSAVALHPEVERVDCVDLSRTVRQTLSYFDNLNHEVRNNPKVHLYIDDGRHYLMTHDLQYDVITFEPPPPGNAGAVNLYTADYYRVCRQHLAQNGLVCQWLPIHQMRSADVKTCIRAFVDVFPDATLWSGYGYTDLLLLGGNEPLHLDYTRIARGMQGPVGDELKGIGVDSVESLLNTYLHGPEALRMYTQDTPPLTDDRPTLEYGYVPQADIDLQFLLAARQTAYYVIHPSPNFATWLRTSTMVDNVYQYYIEERLRHDAWRMDLLSDILHRTSPDNPYVLYVVRATDAWKTLLDRDLLVHPDDLGLMAERAGWYRRRGNYLAGEADWQRYLARKPDDLYALYSCGMCELLGRLPQASTHLEAALSHCPAGPWADEIRTEVGRL
ncbi:MAG TPA: fused MFS/spermidine synthase [Candidatus Xenobia bacterium]|jgi:spermidine synthase